MEDAARIHPRHRAATRADADDVEALQAHPLPGQPAVRGDRRLAAHDQGDVGARPAHVEGNEIAVADQARGVAAAGHTAGRTGEHCPGSEADSVRDRRHATMGLDDEQRPLEACLAQPYRQSLEVELEGRPDIGVHHRRAGALVLLDFRRTSEESET